ncbi:DUF1822 family protein [aff. Roholtiella sp. LEGE 12411]|uniref:DUF1822 family protein n=1 Tax=aff. Roholtiella sp. LEGE 12411 TaxID=1828822 RepID=UPI001880B928|nr:DUF1822 family protein [aff. Roholtiella sp. LEGE 12411]MBE9035031.1 DUF1822 family protein [aff. Roholtiella sp. LEGE 12411]
MSHITENIEIKSIPMAITETALRIARQFAGQQTTLEKKRQVYLNTLAVCVVNDYMEMMDIATDLKGSDSWNPAMRLYSDVADLKLIKLGYLECRPMGYSAPICNIPAEVPDDRIGVVVVKLDTELQQATLFGFAKTVIAGELPINELQSIDDLLAHLDHLECNQSEIKLSHWLQNIFEADWQSLEEILLPKSPQLAFRYRSGVTRGKLVDLGIQLPNQSVALIVTLTPTNSVEIQLKLQVHPNREQACLPENLIVKVLDEKGVAVMEAHAKSTNAHIILEFSAQLGERFSIRLELGDTNITEKFIV